MTLHVLSLPFYYSDKWVNNKLLLNKEGLYSFPGNFRRFIGALLSCTERVCMRWIHVGEPSFNKTRRIDTSLTKKRFCKHNHLHVASSGAYIIYFQLIKRTCVIWQSYLGIFYSWTSVYRIHTLHIDVEHVILFKTEKSIFYSSFKIVLKKLPVLKIASLICVSERLRFS